MAWIVGVIALVVFCTAPAQAQNYPAKPLHFLVPYAPGGITDIAARIVGAKLTEIWGQQVVVENKPGGNGFIAMTAGAKAAPDGYTLVMVTVGDVAINPAMFKEMPYDVERDLAPIAMVSDAPMVLPRTRTLPLNPLPTLSPPPRRSPGGSRSPRRGTAASTRSCSNGWRSIPAPVSNISPARAARRPRPRWRRAIFRSACWRARRSPRTSRADACACWRSRWASVRRSIRNGRRCSRKA